MYPYELFLGIDLYDIFVLIGIIAAMIVYRLCADDGEIPARCQNITLLSIVFAVGGGYAFAILFQAFYNFIESGSFGIDSNTGATFFGGLIGGTGVFFVVYFIGGYLSYRKTTEKPHKERFLDLLDYAACSITIAHGFGRIGCLMAGCCHGKATDSFIGIYMKHPGYKVVPVQLFEAIFLFALFALLFVMIKKKKKYQMPIYMISYGVWRFFIEYARGDDRGASPIKYLSPSQLTALLLIAGGCALLIFEIRKAKMEKQ